MHKSLTCVSRRRGHLAHPVPILDSASSNIGPSINVTGFECVKHRIAIRPIVIHTNLLSGVKLFSAG